MNKSGGVGSHSTLVPSIGCVTDSIFLLQIHKTNNKLIFGKRWTKVLNLWSIYIAENRPSSPFFNSSAYFSRTWNSVFVLINHNVVMCFSTKHEVSPVKMLWTFSKYWAQKSVFTKHSNASFYAVICMWQFSGKIYNTLTK